MYCEVKGPTPAPHDDRGGGIEDAGGERNEMKTAYRLRHW